MSGTYAGSSDESGTPRTRAMIGFAERPGTVAEPAPDAGSLALEHGRPFGVVRQQDNRVVGEARDRTDRDRLDLFEPLDLARHRGPDHTIGPDVQRCRPLAP